MPKSTGDRKVDKRVRDPNDENALATTRLHRRQQSSAEDEKIPAIARTRYARTIAMRRRPRHQQPQKSNSNEEQLRNLTRKSKDPRPKLRQSPDLLSEPFGTRAVQLMATPNRVLKSRALRETGEPGGNPQVLLPSLERKKERGRGGEGRGFIYAEDGGC